MPARHIVICLHDFARGGTERVALTLARHWLDAGRRVTFLCGCETGGVRDQVDPRAGVVELSPPIPRSVTSRLKLGPVMAERLRPLAPDAVFITGNFHFILAHAIRRAFPALPIVAKVSNPLLPALPGPIGAIASRALAAYVAPIDTLVYMAEELADEGRGQIPGAAAAVIAEPNLPAGWQPPPRTAPESPPLVLMLARLEPQKNLSLALRAFAELLKARPARLLILGEGAERRKLEALAARLGIGGAVDMPGYSADVAGDLARASALLLSSRYEGYPAAVVEALAADVPVVATDCTPCLASLIDRPVRGEVVRPAEPAVLAAALSRALDLPFASNGERPTGVAHHDAAASARAYLDLFDRIAAARA